MSVQTSKSAAACPARLPSEFGLIRPMPPLWLLPTKDDLDPRDRFEAAPELEAWIRQAFIDGICDTVNPDHAHLQDATLGCLWTNVELRIGMKRVAATAEAPFSQGNAWKKGRFNQQLEAWFGCMPDFILTFDALLAVRAPDLGFCARCEHELYHCAQAENKDGDPKFSLSTGDPIFAIRGHDVEEFTPIALRYGVKACAGDSENFVRAAMQKPLFGHAEIEGACGTCGR